MDIAPAFDSPHIQLLDEMAAEHAAYMARVQKLGHQYWGERFDRINKELGMCGKEICAQGWREQADATLQELRAEATKCWRRSKGHWATASRSHSGIGTGFSRGENGIWYICLIACD
jgi:uncharacterized protein YkwD